jgi:hypothetical protein
MPTAEARIPTDRAERYLTQLCRHLSEMGAAASGSAWAPARVEYSDREGVVDFGWARCTLEAALDELILSAEAERPEDLRRLQTAVASRLERVGRRDGITVTWQEPEP